MIPLLALLLLNCAFAAHLYFCAGHLPERVASHFRFNGQADGWLSRRSYLTVMACLGGGIALLGIVFAVALFNTQARLLGEYVAWVCCLQLAFILGVHWLTVMGNRRVPPELPMKYFWGLLGLLQIGLILWVCALVWAMGK